jgi:hypothetical protein
VRRVGHVSNGWIFDEESGAASAAESRSRKAPKKKSKNGPTKGSGRMKRLNAVKKRAKKRAGKPVSKKRRK